MSTLVQQPDLKSVEVSGLQPVAKSAGHDGLGTFLSGILPAVNNEIDAYQKERRSHLIALAQNDVINGVTRDVSNLDKESYTLGVNYQKTLGQLTYMQQEYGKMVKETDPKEVSADELLERGEVYRRKGIDVIYNSDLPLAVKEKLYESHLTEASAQATQVQAKIQRVAEDSEVETRKLSVAKLVDYTISGDLGANALASVTQNTIQNLVDARQAVYGDKESLEKSQEVAASSVGAAIDYTLEGIMSSTDGAQNLATLEHLHVLAESMVEFSPSIAMKYRNKINSIISDHEKNNDLYAEQFVNDALTDVKLNPNMEERFTQMQDLLEHVNGLDISLGEKTKLINKIQNEYVRQNDAMLAGIEKDPTMFGTISEAEMQGFSRDSWVTAWKQRFLREFNTDPYLAGAALLQLGNGEEYIPEAIREGSKMMGNFFLGVLSMSDEEFKDNPQWQAHEQNFARFSNTYREFNLTSPYKAAELLTGFPDDVAGILSMAMVNNASLSDIRQLLKDNDANPIPKATTSDMASVINSITADDVGGEKGFFGSHLGTRFKSQSDALTPITIANYKDAVSASLPVLAPFIPRGAPKETILNMYYSKGGAVESKAGYSTTFIPLQMANRLSNIKIEGTNTPITKDMWGDVLDDKREELAAIYKTDPKNVNVTGTTVGDEFTFEVYDVEGEGKILFWKDGVPIPVNNSDTGLTRGTPIAVEVLAHEASKKYHDKVKNSDDIRQSGIEGGWNIDSIMRHGKKLAGGVVDGVGNSVKGFAKKGLSSAASIFDSTDDPVKAAIAVQDRNVKQGGGFVSVQQANKIALSKMRGSSSARGNVSYVSYNNKPAVHSKKTGTGRETVAGSKNYISTIPRVHDYATGKTYDLKINASWARAYGGDIAFTREAVPSLQGHEGWRSKSASIPDANTGKIAHNYGMGMTDKSTQLTAERRRFFLANQDNPQAQFDMNGEFVADFYTSMKVHKDFNNAGIPFPSSNKPLPKQYYSSALLILDAAYHGHNGALYAKNLKGRDGVIQAMNAKDYKTGLAMLKNSTVWNRKQPNSVRNKSMMGWLHDHYKYVRRLI